MNERELESEEFWKNYDPWKILEEQRKNPNLRPCKGCGDLIHISHNYCTHCERK